MHWYDKNSYPCNYYQMSVKENQETRKKGSIMEELSRRRFLTGSAALAGVASLGALGACSEPVEDSAGGTDNLEWDEETDVVVIGFGGAGSTAAIGAANAGANVILLEKAPEKDAGGNTSVCGGGGLFPSTGTKKEEAFRFLRYQMPELIIDDDEIWGFIEEMYTQNEWLQAHGAQVDSTVNPNGGGAMYAHIPDSGGLDGTTRIGGNGAGMFKFLKEATEDCKEIDIRYETPGKRLIFNQDTKEVLGVVAVSNGVEIKIKANRGVVMACGGFENDPWMLNTFYPPEVPIYPTGTPYNTGDGIRMITEIGAKLRGFSSIEWGNHNCKAASEEIGVHVGFTFMGTSPWANAIMVNDQGKRFVNETQPVVPSVPMILRPLHEKSQIPELAFDMATLRYTNLPMYYIFGETKIHNGPLFNGASKEASNHWAHIKDWYTWSDDNQAEISRGWIKKADTLEALAGLLNVDPLGLVASVATYDADCASENDTTFGRTAELTPIGDGPFYGCELGLGIINTQGGPARDAAHHVLDWNNNIIPRLYSAGEFGSIYVFLYQGAGNVSEQYGGRDAGEHAAEEEPWS